MVRIVVTVDEVVLTSETAGVTGQLGSLAGYHERCGGRFWRRGYSATHDQLNCDQCRLNVPFPTGVTTYTELERHFDSFQSLLSSPLTRDLEADHRTAQEFYDRHQPCADADCAICRAKSGQPQDMTAHSVAE